MAPIVTVLMLVGIHLISAQISYISPTIIHGDGSEGRCPSEEQLAASRQELNEIVASTLSGVDLRQRCGAGEWTRVAYLNMKDPLQTCPSAWRENTTNGVRVCGRPPSSNDMCHGAPYSTGGHIYTKVCGRVIGYQIGHPDAFNSDPIDFAYVEGVSITHGRPRSHIWTFTADFSETDSSIACPCDTGSSNNPPSFVGNNYYCESGNMNRSSIDYFLYADDPLWDGKQCSTEGTCCSNGRTPPWFSITLDNPTNDNIEVRICANFNTSEDTPIELLEIYIQ